MTLYSTVFSVSSGTGRGGADAKLTNFSSDTTFAGHLAAVTAAYNAIDYTDNSEENLDFNSSKTTSGWQNFCPFITFLTVYNTATLPPNAVVTGAQLGFVARTPFSVATGETLTLSRFRDKANLDNLTSITRSDHSAYDAATGRITVISGAASRYTFTLTQDAYSALSRTGLTAFAIRPSWDLDETQPSLATLGGQLGWAIKTSDESADYAAALYVEYTLSSRSFSDPARRFELPTEVGRFVPVRSSTRYGTPLSLQDVRAARIELPTQVQDYLNEQPPFVGKVLAGEPNSRVSGRAGTLLVDPQQVQYPLWYKMVGSSNTGWVPLAFAWNNTGFGSEFSTIEVNSVELS